MATDERALQQEEPPDWHLSVYNMVLANDNYIFKIYFGAPLDKIFATYIQ